MPKEKIQELLRVLLLSVYSLCVEGVAKKSLMSEQRLVFKRKVEGYRYDDEGPHFQSWYQENIAKPTWSLAVSGVVDSIRKQKIFNDTVAEMCANCYIKKDLAEISLRSLISNVARKTLEGQIKDEAQLEKYVVAFLEDTDKKEKECKLIAQLNGVILQPDSIKMDENTLLRKPRLEEIEIEYPAEDIFMAGEKMFKIPPAVLELKGESPSGSFYNAQVEIEEDIALLRLFKVGGVEYIKYDIHSESYFPLGLISSESLRLLKFDTYLVENKDVESLKKFWANMKGITLPIPVHIDRHRLPSELSIAYERYSDSLDVGVMEKRIANAVMGMEALYLSAGERQELTYKLSMRAAKLLGQIGYNVEEVCENLSHAYDIRSTYVHGKTLTPKERKKHEKNVGDLNHFPRVVMDYLRASIISLLKMTNKKSIIKIIDDSLLDSTKETELKNLLFRPYEEGGL